MPVNSIFVTEICETEETKGNVNGGNTRGPGIVKKTVGKIVDVTKEQLMENLKSLVDEVSYAVDSIEENSTKYKLDSVEISLSISGEGTLYLAKAGAEASITLTLQRNA